MRTKLTSLKIINPYHALGDPRDGLAPCMDVPVTLENGHAGGWQISQEAKTLDFAHALHARVLRDIEKRLRGPREIEARLIALDAGYDETVGRKGRKAIKFLTTKAPVEFDQKTKDLLDRLESSGKLAKHFESRLGLVRLLNQLRVEAMRIATLEKRFKRDNIDQGKKPSQRKLQLTFLPTAVRSEIATPSIDEMLLTAMHGFVNLAVLFRDFSYLEQPLAILVQMGKYKDDGLTASEIKRMIVDYQSVILKREAPREIIADPRCLGQFEDVCLHIEKAWKQNLWDSLLLQCPAIAP